VAILLILLSAGIHATWNLLAKRLPGGAEAAWLFTAVAVAVYTPFAAVVIAATGFRPHGEQWLFLLGTGVFQAIYFVVLRRGYAAGDLSVVYPLARGSGPLVAMLLAVVLVGERPTALTILGALTISLGTLVLSLPLRGSGDHRLAVAYGLVTGAIIGGYTVWDGYAVSELGIPALVLAWTADVGRAVWLAPVAARRRNRLRGLWDGHRREVVGIGMLSTGSYALVLLAMTLAPISSIAPAREISIVAGTLMGMVLLGEPGGARRLGSAIVITLGVGLIALG
jgi:drug/metabolite transporter (DMT)-like permease